MAGHIQALSSRYTNILTFLSINKRDWDAKCDRPCDVYSEKQDKDFNGVVTYLDHGLGIVNDNVIFDPSNFKHITLGSSVRGKAHKEYTNWKVVLLEFDQDSATKQPTDEIDLRDMRDELDKAPTTALEQILHDNSYNDKAITDNIVDNSSVPTGQLQAVVREVYDDFINTISHGSFLISNCEIKYPPQKGDALRIEYSLMGKNDGSIVALAVEYLRIKTFMAQVTDVNKKGYIFDYKIFCNYTIYEEKQISNIRKFFVVAVESSCPFRCNWRAVSVCPDTSYQYSQPFEFLPSAVDCKPDAALSRKLPRPPNPIQSRDRSKEVWIDVVENVKLDHLYNTKVLPVTVRFNLESPIILTDIYIRSINNIEQISLDESCKGEGLFPATIDGVCHRTFALICTAKVIGASTEKLVFSFDRMSAFKDVSIMVGGVDTDTNAEHLMAIKGVKPYVGRRFLPRKLPNAEIPKVILDAFTSDDMQGLMPTLRMELEENNFVKKMTLFLFLEELEKRRLYTTFTLYKTTFGFEGEYLLLNLHWMDDNSPFIVGDRVNVFPLAHSQSDGTTYFQGFIHIVEGTKIYFKFEPTVMSQLRNQFCRVDFLCSRTPYRKCHMGLYLVEETFGTANLFPTTLPLSPPQASYMEEGFAIVRNPLDDTPDAEIPVLEWVKIDLNAEQKTAIRNILVGSCRPIPYIIFGPPGTGKTITVVEAICQIFLLVPHSRILVAAPSNSASDLITERLVETGIFDELQLARLNGYNRSKMTIPDSISPYCNDVSETASVVDCRIIVCTTVSAAALYEAGVAADHFTHVFLDEAGHMTEAESSIPISFVNKQDGQVVLAGDPKQLGPVVMNQTAERHGFGVSLLERLSVSPLYAPDYTSLFASKMGGSCEDKAYDVRDTRSAMDSSSMYDSRMITLLVRNYRSTAPLLQIPSLLFYHSALVAPERRQEDELYRSWDMLPNKNFPLLFYGIHGECTTNGSGSRENVMEATIISEMVESLLHHGIDHEEIAVITPYRLQVKQVISQLAARNISSVQVGSVQKFQGQERGAIILSTVRSYSASASSNSAYDIGFVSSPQRFNVALTRAKFLLIVIGDPTVLQLNYYWKSLLSYCKCNGALVDTRGAKLRAEGLQR